MSDRPTPRTDKAEYQVRLGRLRRMVVRPELARQLERELAEACGILDRALAQLPVGSLSAHKPDSVPERVGDVLKQLAEALEQRDRLAAALEACREDSCELLGERSWWKDEPHCNYSNRYDETVGNIVRADGALDSIKGGSCD